MHQYTWTYTLAPENASADWVLDNAPEGAKGLFITHVQDETGNLHTPDHQEIDLATGNLILHFGVTLVSGTAYGSYYLDHAPDDGSDTNTDGDHDHTDSDGSHDHDDGTAKDEVIVDRAGNTVNITVNQYDHGNLQSQSSS
jgi:hypothetical protein